MEDIEEEREKLMAKISSLLKDPYEMKKAKANVIELHFASVSKIYVKILKESLLKEKWMQNKHFRYVVNLKVFKGFLEKLFEYLDEVYYIEKKRNSLNEGSSDTGNKEKGPTGQLLEAEKNRLAVKASLLGQVYTGIIYKTIWRRNTPWEVTFQKFMYF